MVTQYTLKYRPGKIHPDLIFDHNTFRLYKKPE